MPEEKDPLDRIKFLLESKSAAKQITYRNLLAAFDVLRKESNRIITELTGKVKPDDEDVTLHFRDVNEHEFEVKLAGDLLTFVLHTNVVTFDPNGTIMQDPYIHQNPVQAGLVARAQDWRWSSAYSGPFLRDRQSPDWPLPPSILPEDNPPHPPASLR